jgi:hypothetical protein
MKSASATDMNYAALYLSIVWYRQLTPEESFSTLLNRTNTKPECRNITSKMVQVMDRIMTNKNFRSMDKLEYRFKVNRYTILELVKQYRMQKLSETLKKIQLKKEEA